MKKMLYVIAAVLAILSGLMIVAALEIAIINDDGTTLAGALALNGFVALPFSCIIAIIASEIKRK